MLKNKLLAILVVATVVLCGGCSYKELDEQIQDAIQQIGGMEDQTYVENLNCCLLSENSH